MTGFNNTGYLSITSTSSSTWTQLPLKRSPYYKRNPVLPYLDGQLQRQHNVGLPSPAKNPHPDFHQRLWLHRHHHCNAAPRKTRQSTSIPSSPPAQHTVYEGELTGLLLAFYLTSSSDVHADTTIYTDNQAALLALKAKASKSAFYLLQEAQKRYLALSCPPRAHPVNIKFQWCPAHVGIPGNKLVDSYAKEAALGTSSPRESLPDILQKPLAHSAAVLCQTFHANLKQLQQDLWLSSPRAKRHAAINLNTPSPTYRKMAKSLTQKYMSIIMQLCTKHVPLAAYLYRIQKAESPICPYCFTEKETVFNFLVKCKAHNTQRAAMQLALGHCAQKLSILLNNKARIGHTLKFIHANRIFVQFQ